ncbi:PAS domain S-box protein [Spirosoma jeollabukense]
MNTDLVTTSELFELLTKATRDAVWHWDLEADTVWWNEGFSTLFGYDTQVSESGPESWYNHVHPNDKERVLNSIYSAIDQGATNWSAEYQFCRNDGTYATVYDRGYILHRDGKSVRMVGAMQDITDRVALQRARDESEERLRFALQSAQLGTWEFDPVLGTVNWDDRAKEIFGIPRANVMAYENSLAYIYPDDSRKVEDAVKWALNPASGGHYDVKYRTKAEAGSSFRWVRSIGQTHFTEAGQAYRFSGVVQDITEEMLAKEKAEFSEQQARIAVEGAGSGSFSINMETNEIIYSASYARIVTGEITTGLSRDVFIEHVHPDDQLIRKRAYEMAANTGTVSYEARFIWNDGSIHWVKILGQYLANSAGKAVTFSGIALDITQQKEQAKALKEAEERFTIAFNNTSMGMAFTDKRANFTLVNEAYTKLLGYSTEEMCQLNSFEVTHPDDQKGNRQLFEEVVRGDRPFFNLVKRYIHKDGSIRWVQLNVTRVADAQDETHSMIIIANDISAEVATRQALRDSEALFRSITTASTAALWITNESLAITYVSPKWIDWTGVPLEKHLGNGWLNYVVIEDRQRAAEHFLSDFRAFRYHESQFRVFNVTDGKVRWVVCTGTPQYAADGRFAGYIGAILDISERIEANAKLRASDERFRNMITQAPVAIGILNGRNLVVETANTSMLEIWGKDTSIIGLPLLKVLPEIDGQGFIELLENVYDSGSSHYGYETHAQLHRKGKLEDAYFNFVYAPVRDELGKTNGVLVVATEVTTQVKATRALQESEQRFRNLIEEAPVAVSLFVGPEMIVELPNEAMLKLWGKSNTVIGKPLHEGVPELIGQPFLDILQEVYATGIEYSAQEARTDLMVDGKLKTYYFNFTYKPLRNAAGTVYAILDMAVDVTEQVLARRTIEESELRFRTLMEAMSPMTWTNTPEGEIDFFNQRWYDYTGLNFEQTKAWGWQAVVHPDELAHTLEVYGNALRTGTIFVLENRYRRGSDGAYRWHLNRALPIQDETGAIILWVGTATDIHEQKELEAELEQQVEARTEQLLASNYDLRRSNDNLEKFAYIASHDLQEPLRKIQAFGDILKSQYADQLGEGVDNLERMQSAASRMSQLIKDLLTFSRISTRQETTSPVHLNHVITGVLADLEVAITQAEARVRIGNLPTVLGDESQLRQLFQNLLSNALKFRKADVRPVIQIQVEQVGPNDIPESVRPIRPVPAYYSISVSDNGIGFDEKYIDRIFQVFQRLHSRTKYAGTGIGLAICEKVATNHGGAITAVSQLGQGATFIVYLPVI